LPLHQKILEMHDGRHVMIAMLAIATLVITTMLRWRLPLGLHWLCLKGHF